MTTRVQGKTQNTTTADTSGSVSMSFDNPLTTGSVMLLTVISRGDPTGNGAPVHAQGDVSSNNIGGGGPDLDWTLLGTASTSDHTVSAWLFPEAYAGDGQNHREITFTWTPGVPAPGMHVGMQAVELGGHGLTYPIASAVSATDDSGGSSVASLSSGATGVFEYSPVLSFTAATWRNGASWPISPTAAPWSGNREADAIDAAGVFTGGSSWGDLGTADSVDIGWQTDSGPNAPAAVVAVGVIDAAASGSSFFDGFNRSGPAPGPDWQEFGGLDGYLRDYRYGHDGVNNRNYANYWVGAGAPTTDEHLIEGNVGGVPTNARDIQMFVVRADTTQGSPGLSNVDRIQAHPDTRVRFLIRTTESGSWTIRAENPNYTNYSQGDRLRAEVDDTQVRLLNMSQGGEVIVSWDHGGFGDGHTGVGLYNWKGTNGTGLGWIDNVAGGDLGGVPPSTGTIAATDTPDTVAVSGSVTTSGTVDGTDTADSAALSATVNVSGTVDGADSPDTADITGTVAVAGAVAATDNPDSASFTGTVGDLITATIAGTDTADTAAVTGDVTATGTVAATDNPDSAAISGVVVGAPSTGTIAATDSPDTAAFVGTVVSNDSTGTIAATDQPDLAAVVGFVTITATLNGTDLPDSASLVGTVIGDFAPISTPTRHITDLTAARAITDRSGVRTIIEP